MREIKFRAWDKELKNWSKIALRDRIYNINFLTDYVWCQYTGLKDKNGAEIYEGDIVKYNDTKYEVYREYGSYMLRRTDIDSIDYDDFPQSFFTYEDVEFVGCMNDYCVSFYELACNEEDFEEWLSCEVIGNIYENPELL